MTRKLGRCAEIGSRPATHPAFVHEEIVIAMRNVSTNNVKDDL